MTAKKVSYYYELDSSSYYFSDCHPMVPERVNMTHELVQNYNLFSHMEIMRYNQATASDLKSIHLPDYIDYIKNLSPNCFSTERFDEDCPIFNGIYDYSSKIVGGSLAAATKINEGDSDICVNWSGGMHHAKKRGPSGFCYTNDIVACIVELLRYHKRVMYIDLDVHHGDGVEEFFYDTNRVMTISFHQYGNFFPGTGSLKDKGVNEGKNYSINIPLKKGINDMNYLKIFKEVISKAVERYQPEALVLQMGADSVAGDKLGGFNLSSEGHSKCLEFALKYQIPAVILGGGGYSIYNVARTWTLETGVILGKELSNDLPENSFLKFSEFHRNLRIPREHKSNQNSPEYIKKILKNVLETLSQTEIAPSVPIQAVPDNWNINQPQLDITEDREPDTRLPQDLLDTIRTNPLEYYESDFDNILDEFEFGYISDSHRYQIASDESLLDIHHTNLTPTCLSKSREDSNLPAFH